MGVVHGRLGARLPGLFGFVIAAVGADELDLGQVAEHRGVEMAQLTAQEQRILLLVAEGKTNKEIADGMFLSNKTVSTYKTRLLLKLNARSLVDLIELAQRNGLV